jgi:hypothetical protein
MLTIPKCLDPTEKLEIKPPSTTTKSILLKASITITKRKCDKGSPSLKPRELLKKQDGLLFTKTKKAPKKYNALSKSVISPQKHTSSTGKVRNPN